MSQPISIQFKSRSPGNISDKKIADSYSNGGPFDVDLVTSDNRIVSGHRFVLCMFSRYLAKQMDGIGIDGKILIDLKRFPFDVVDKVVELLYFRKINVNAETKTKVKEAVSFLIIPEIQFSDETKTVDGNKVLPERGQQHQMDQQCENGAANAQMAAYTLGKRQRSQSVYVESPSHPQHGAIQSVPQAPAASLAQSRSNLLADVNIPNVSISTAPSRTITNGGQTVQSHPVPAKNPTVAPVQKSMIRMPAKAASAPQTPSKQPNPPKMSQMPNLPAGLTVQSVAKTAATLTTTILNGQQQKSEQQKPARPDYQPIPLNTPAPVRPVETVVTHAPIDEPVPQLDENANNLDVAEFGDAVNDNEIETAVNDDNEVKRQRSQSVYVESPSHPQHGSIQSVPQAPAASLAQSRSNHLADVNIPNVSIGKMTSRTITNGGQTVQSHPVPAKNPTVAPVQKSMIRMPVKAPSAPQTPSKQPNPPRMSQMPKLPAGLTVQSLTKMAATSPTTILNSQQQKSEQQQPARPDYQPIPLNTPVRPVETVVTHAPIDEPVRQLDENANHLDVAEFGDAVNDNEIETAVNDDNEVKGAESKEIENNVKEVNENEHEYNEYSINADKDEFIDSNNADLDEYIVDNDMENSDMEDIDMEIDESTACTAQDFLDYSPDLRDEVAEL